VESLDAGCPREGFTVRNDITRLKKKSLAAALPYSRNAWLIAFVFGGTLAWLLQLGWMIPVPFMLLVAIVVASSMLGNTLSGTLSGLSGVAVLAFAYISRIGPDALIGSPMTISMGMLIVMLLAVSLGYLRENLNKALIEIDAQRRELEAANKTLASRVSKDSEELSLIRDRLIVSQNRLRHVTKRWVDAQEADRRSIARELHDDIGQSLAALRISLESNKRNFARDATTMKFIETSYQLVDKIIASVRELSLDLRPSLLDDLGLIAALKEHVFKQLTRAKVKYNLSVEGDDRKIDPVNSIAAYRIVQEAVTNILKHGNATKATLDIKVGQDTFTIDICDNGRGFRQEADLDRQFGVASMHERAALVGGKLEVSSSAGEGTKIFMELPVSLQTQKDAVA
jgi:signal transduction histidine kinase